MCARWSPVLLSGDGHTSVRGRRETPRDEADLCWQLLLQLLCIFQFQVQSRAAIRVPEPSSSFHFSACHFTLIFFLFSSTSTSRPPVRRNRQGAGRPTPGAWVT